MMNTLIFATSNNNKAKEVQQILQNKYTIQTLKDLDCLEEIPEPFDTLEDNSLTKAQFVFQQFHTDCFSEDTGLFVEALPNEPGVKSARYAGNTATNDENIEKLLSKMQGVENRKAFFKTIITLIKNGETHQFEGKCEGRILIGKCGVAGFGYDPIFVPNGAYKTFAEMTMAEKNEYSHRRKAVDKLIFFLDKK